MRFDIDSIREKASKDYEGTWVEVSKLLKLEGRLFRPLPKGKEHPLGSLIERFRKALVNLGFEETFVPIIVDKREVYAQYGPEAPIILDRVFFLAGLDRPDIGIGGKRIEAIKAIVPGFDKIDELQRIFRRYKKGEIEADRLVEAFVDELGIREEQATELLSKVFPELKDLKPLPMDLTLRSHTTAAWFRILKEALKREPLPIQLFSIGPKFRREQRLDATHLYESYTASIVIMAEEMSLEDGEAIIKDLFKILELGSPTFVRKDVTSKYYAQGTEFEVFLRHPRMGQLVEVGDMGFYSPIALSNYEIPYPVFNAGFGIERILMILTGIEDIRRLVYPYLYGEISFTDRQIAEAIKLIKSPRTPEGARLAEAIERAALLHANDQTPARIIAFHGEFLGKPICIEILKEEPGKKLLGPAALNPIVVEEGNIIGQIPSKVGPSSIRTPFTYLKAIASLAAYEAERLVERTDPEARVEVKNVRSLTDVNLRLEDAVRRFLESEKKRIDIRGPVFLNIRIVKEKAPP
jgi:O-phosphoseryl-tRNA synthetase